ncbi:MAG: CsgG/HfaB family protein [Geobacteraceae bacterium]|nr:CsgG/HfaB family protein [Geobacteraceae bacterium]
MIAKRFCHVPLFLAILLAFPAVSFGGQVVTPDIRDQARKLVREEKALKTEAAQKTLAVLYFRNLSGNEDLNPLRKGLPLMLITDLSQVEGLQVVERVMLQALLEELGLGASGIVEPGTAPRVGRLLGAGRLVGGDIGGVESKLRLQSETTDVPTEAPMGVSTADGPLDELFRLEKTLLFDIIRILKIEIGPEVESKLRKPCSTNKKALMSLFEGVDAGDKKDYQGAASLYEKALKEDPGICIAGEALRELHDLGLIAAKKRSADLLRSLRNDTSLTNQLTPKEEMRDVKAPLPGTSTDTNIQLNFPAAPKDR